MKSIFKNKILIPSFLALAVLSVSCTKEITNVSPQKQGGEDSGGGGTFGSTYGDVEAQFKDINKLKESLGNMSKNLSVLLMNNPTLYKKIYARVVSAEDEANTLDKIKNQMMPQTLPPIRRNCKMVPNSKECDVDETLSDKEVYKLSIWVQTDKVISYQKLFPNDLPIKNSDFSITDTNLFERILPQVKIRLDYTDSCKDRHSEDKTASVTSFTMDSDICVSIKELTKIPKESLKKQIDALLMHEIMHLLGFLEQDAVDLQTFILNNYDSLIPNKNNSNYATTRSVLLKPKELRAVLHSILNTHKREEFGETTVYEDAIFINDMDLIHMLSLEAHESIDVYVRYIKENQTRNFEADISNLYALEKIFAEMDSLYKISRDFVRPAVENNFYKYSSQEEYYFIYDRLDYLYGKLKDINHVLTTNDE